MVITVTGLKIITKGDFPSDIFHCLSEIKGSTVTHKANDSRNFHLHFLFITLICGKREHPFTFVIIDLNERGKNNVGIFKK
jgi:hypothetical protein